jgi:uncharacterized protein YjbI with pentapeptide repeats
LEKAYIDYSGFYQADLLDAHLNDATIINSDMSCAKLKYIDLQKATIKNTSIIESDLQSALLRNATLEDVNLFRADLQFAHLEDASLSRVNLENSNLEDTHLSENEECRRGLILKEDMIGYKKCRDNRIVKLCVPKGAVVFSINNYKCRTNIAKVLEITNLAGKVCRVAYSNYEPDFKYKVGEIVEVEDFALRYNLECASGIHFFRTKEEAIDY